MNRETFERIVREKTELSERVKKLADFLVSDKALDISKAQEILLVRQLNVMKEYLDILEVRVELEQLLEIEGWVNKD